MWLCNLFYSVAAGVLLFCRSSAWGSADHFWWWMKFEHGTFRIPDPRSFQPLHSNNMMAASDDSSNWIILTLQPVQTIVELARCERFMTTRAEFHFSWIYTFSATPRSLRIWASDPSRESGCDPALPTQLCQSSGSSFPHRLYFSMWTCLAMHLCSPVKGQRLDKLPVFSVPWRFCNCYGFFLVFEILNIRQISSTQQPWPLQEFQKLNCQEAKH